MLSVSEIPMRSGKYSFKKEVRIKLESFESWLRQKHYGKSTTRQKSNYAGLFLAWLESENLQIKEVRYKNMLSFIDYCNLESLSKKQINTILLAIRNYYDSLKESDPKLINPAQNLRVKGEVRRHPISIIKYQKLEQIYSNYQAATDRDKRNKVILGLLIYQGLTTEELHQLQVIDLKLKQGKIFIPGNRRRNSRMLELQPCQVLDLHE